LSFVKANYCFIRLKGTEYTMAKEPETLKFALNTYEHVLTLTVLFSLVV